MVANIDEYEVDGDGGDAKVNDEDLKWLKNEVEDIANNANSGVWSARESCDNTRFCKWPGQSDDGKKHRENLGGAEPFPFEGASDARIRLADGTINTLVSLLFVSAMRNDLKVTGIESLDSARAQKIKTLLRWVITNQLGSQYVWEIIKLLQYLIADSPAVAIMGVYWNREPSLRMKDITVEELMQITAEMVMENPEEWVAVPESMTVEELHEAVTTAVKELTDIINDPERQEDGVRILQEFYPHLKEKRAKRVIKELRDTEKSSFPVPYLKKDQPAITAHKLFEDIFIPSNTPDDIQRARVIFHRGWYSKVEIKSKIVSEGWKESFVNKVVGDGDTHKGHEGLSGFPVLLNNVSGEYISDVRAQDAEPNKGMYEVVTAYYRAVNDDSIPGIYVVPFSCFVDEEAKERALLDYEHDKYPFVAFRREVLSSKLLESRGVSELLLTHQSALKMLHDSRGDFTSISTVPPIKGPQKRPKGKLLIRPMGYIPERRKDEIKVMDMGRYPVGNERMQEEIRRQVAEYFGLPHKDVSPEISHLLQEVAVLLFLSSLKDVFLMLLQLCKQYWPDEVIARVVGGKGLEFDRSREEIQGNYDIKLSFDVQDISLETLKIKADMIANIMVPLDTQSTIQRDKLVARLFHSLDPNMAEEAIVPVETASQSELQAARMDFVMIKAGIEPEMAEGGQNFGLRFQEINEILQKNPTAHEEMSEVSRAILDAYMQHLQFMVQQLTENSQIGKVGAKSVLEGGM